MYSNSSPPVCCKVDYNPQQYKESFGSIIIESCFDSGNLDRAQKQNTSSGPSFDLYIAPDCFKTQQENNYKTWFYFSVTGVSTQAQVNFTIQNMNFQGKIFREGHTPVFQTSQTNVWERMQCPNLLNSLVTTEYGIEFTFPYSFQDAEEKVFFAFCLPWSYSENEEFVNQYEKEALEHQKFYFHRNLLINSKENRKVQLITISSFQNITNKREKTLPSIFPGSQERAFVFEGKKYVFVSARVHPGQVPGSHVFNGIFQLLNDPNDPIAEALRDNFVFLLVPIINPDGVYRGHYRTDTQGLNLNRYYLNPNIEQHPSIFAIHEVIMYHNEEKRLLAYLDLHAHATRRGCFMYGNCTDFQNQYEGCNFTEKNMYSKDKSDGLSKEGAGRVAFYQQTQLNLCFTLQCNYNMGMQTNQQFERTSGLYKNQESKSSPYQSLNSEVVLNFVDLNPSSICQFYIAEHYQNIGLGMMQSLLDYCNIHPFSRLPNTPFKNIMNLKLHMANNLTKIIPHRFDSNARKAINLLNSKENINTVLKTIYLFLEKGSQLEIVEQVVKPAQTQKQMLPKLQQPLQANNKSEIRTSKIEKDLPEQTGASSISKAAFMPLNNGNISGQVRPDTSSKSKESPIQSPEREILKLQSSNVQFAYSTEYSKGNFMRIDKNSVSIIGKSSDIEPQQESPGQNIINNNSGSSAIFKSQFKQNLSGKEKVLQAIAFDQQINRDIRLSRKEEEQKIISPIKEVKFGEPKNSSNMDAKKVNNNNFNSVLIVNTSNSTGNNLSNNLNTEINNAKEIQVKGGSQKQKEEQQKAEEITSQIKLETINDAEDQKSKPPLNRQISLEKIQSRGRQRESSLKPATFSQKLRSKSQNRSAGQDEKKQKNYD